jgi:MFS superfamily sulfate permease-like transporter
MAEIQEITSGEWKKALLYIVPLVIIVTISSIFLLPQNMLLFIIVIVISIVVVIIMAAREEKNVMFKCPTCGQEFEISAMKSTLSPHGVVKKDGKWVEWKYLECPVCHTKEKMFPIKKQ